MFDYKAMLAKKKGFVLSREDSIKKQKDFKKQL